MSRSLSSLLFSIVHMAVPSGLYNVVCVCFLRCYVSSYRWVECVLRSELMGLVEKVRFGNLHPSVIFGLTWGVRLFVLLLVCVLRLYCARASGPLSHYVMVDSSCHDGCQCTS